MPSLANARGLSVPENSSGVNVFLSHELTKVLDSTEEVLGRAEADLCTARAETAAVALERDEAALRHTEELAHLTHTLAAVQSERDTLRTLVSRHSPSLAHDARHPHDADIAILTPPALPPPSQPIKVDHVLLDVDRLSLEQGNDAVSLPPPLYTVHDVVDVAGVRVMSVSPLRQEAERGALRSLDDVFGVRTMGGTVGEGVGEHRDEQQHPQLQGSGGAVATASRRYRAIPSLEKVVPANQTDAKPEGQKEDTVYARGGVVAGTAAATSLAGAEERLAHLEHGIASMLSGTPAPHDMVQGAPAPLPAFIQPRPTVSVPEVATCSGECTKAAQRELRELTQRLRGVLGEEEHAGDGEGGTSLFDAVAAVVDERDAAVREAATAKAKLRKVSTDLFMANRLLARDSKHKHDEHSNDTLQENESLKAEMVALLSEVAELREDREQFLGEVGALRDHTVQQLRETAEAVAVHNDAVAKGSGSGGGGGGDAPPGAKQAKEAAMLACMDELKRLITLRDAFVAQLQQRISTLTTTQHARDTAHAATPTTKAVHRAARELSSLQDRLPAACAATSALEAAIPVVSSG